MEKLTPFQFAKSIKDKYPQYVDVDDIELTNKILSKYPQYKDRVDLLAGASPLIPYEQEKNWLGVDLDTDKTQEEEKNIQIPEKLGNLSVDLEPLPEVGVTTESVFGTKKPEYGEKRGGENYAQVANKIISGNMEASAGTSISSLKKQVIEAYDELSKKDRVQTPVKSSSIKPFQYLDATDEVAERNLMSARKTLEDAEKILNSPVDKKTGTWFDIAGDRIESWGKGAGERLTNEDFWTMGMSAINRNISALNIAKKLEKGEQLRRDEELLLDSFANLQFANMVRADNMSSAYRGGQGTVDMVKFIAELYVSGGVGRLATKGAEKALVKTIAKKVEHKFAQHLANTGTKILTRTGAAFIGATITPATFEKTTENLFGNALGEFKGIDLKYTGRQDAMTGFDSYINGWADMGIEFATEMSGGSLGVIGKIIKEVPGIDKVLKRLARTKLGSAGRVLGNNPTLKRAGIHGFLGEYNEEFDGSAVRHLLRLEDFKESFWNWDAQATLLYTLGPVAGFSSGMNGIQGAKIKHDFKNSSKQFDDLLLKNGYSQQEIEDLKIAMLDASPEMLGQQLRSIVGSMDDGIVEVDGKPTFNEEIYGTALQFAIDASIYNAYTHGLDEKLEEYRTQAKAFIEQNQNPDMGAIVYAEVAGKPVRVTKGNIVFNGDKLDRENSSKEFYYENENGEIIPANIELVSKLLEVTPIEQATEVAAQRMTAPLIAKEQNEEVRPYEVGEQVTIDVEGSRVMGQIVEKTENGYKFTDSTGMTIDIEPRQIIDEDNLQGVDNGVLVEYMLNGKPQTGLVEDFYQYRQQGQAIVDGNLVNLSDIIGIAQPETDSNMSEITPENEGTQANGESNVSEEGRKTEQNDIKYKKADIERRRQEAIEERIPLNELPVKDRKRFKKDPKKYLEEKIKEIESDLLKNPNLDIAPDVYIYELNSLNEINAKHDAELAALEAKPTTQSEVEATAKALEGDPDLANIDPIIQAARNGDKQAQQKLEKYGLKWEQTTTYRFVGQSEVDVLLANERVNGKRGYADAGIDVTTSPKVTTAASNEYRVTFKESFDVNNGLGKVRAKNDELGDHNLEQGRGYDINDVAKIERLDENGNVVETVYDANATSTPQSEVEPTAAGETPVAELQAEQEKQTFIESLPVNNKGEIDQKKMTVAQTIQYFEYQYGVDETLKAAEQQVKNIEKQLKTAETALSKDPFNIAKKKRASQIQAELQEYKDYVYDKKKAKLRQVGPSTSSIVEEKRRAEAEAQRQAERAEIEALHGAPDVTVDKAKDARARGYRVVNGERVNRQEATTPTHFTEAQRKFSDKVSVPVKRTIVEVETLQSSHKNGVKNDKFFITEAQPKPRTDDVSQYAAESIASNINPQEITGGVTAYTGAPIANNHREIIQGNNRVRALQLMYENHKKQAEKYKQYLIENAADYGMTAEQVAAMTNPVAVDIAEVSDEEAIRLGQLNATDTESGGVQRIPAQQSAVSLGEDIGRLSSILYESGEDDLSMHEALDNNGKKALEYLHKKGIINNTQFQSAFDSRNNLTPEAKKDLQDITAFALFEGANDNMQQMFRALPDKAQKAILQTIHRNAANPEGSSIMNDIRGAIEAYYLLKQDESFNTNTEYEALIRLATQLKGQTQLFNTETNLPLQKYSNFSIELAVLFKSDKQNTLKSRFNNLYDALQGVGGDMFHPAETLNLVEAIKKHFNNIDYVPNGQVQRNNVAKHNTERKARQQLGDEAAATREQSEKGEQPSQRGRGNEGNNKEEVTLLKGQERIDFVRNTKFIETGETRIDDDYEADEPEHEQRKVYVPVFVNAWEYADNTNPDVEYFPTIDEALEDLKTKGDMSEVDSYFTPSKHLAIELQEVWIDRDGNEYEDTGTVINYDDWAYNNKDNDFVKQFGQESYIETNTFEGREDTARELENKVTSDINKSIIKEHNGLTIKSTQSGKYRTVVVENQQGEEVGTIQLRIADHSYNPRNNDYAARKGNFISIEIANKNETKNRFNGKYGLQFNGDNTFEEVVEAVNERITEIIDSWGIDQVVEDSEMVDAEIASQTHNNNPTEKQKESGVYDKARINLQGYNITLETLKGQQRTGIDPNGKPWSITMNNHYGELDGTIGYDGDPIDVFVGPNPKNGKIFVVDQVSQDGSFDESKVMLGFDSSQEAQDAYMSNFEEGWQGFGSITEAGDKFKEWLYDGKKQRKPFSEYKDTPEAVEVEKPAEKQEKLNDEVEKSGQSLAEESEAVKELREEIKDLKSQKAKLIKEMSDRNGLFGDTKSDPNDLFGGGEVDSNAFISRLDEINNRIKTVNDKIKKQIKAEETGKAEAKQQQSINLEEESLPKLETSEQKKSEKLSEDKSDKAVSQEDKKSEKDKSFPKEKSKEDKSGQKVEKIEDFGEKIEGARKHLATLNTSTKEDITSMPLSKSFPKPDFKQLVESGQMTIDAAIVMNYLYENIPSKPRKHYRVAGWANKVQGVIDTYNTLLENSEDAAKIIEKVEKNINEFKLYSATLKALGFPANNVSMGGHKIKQFYGHEGYSIVNGSFILGTYAELEDAAKALSEIINKKKTKTTETKLNIYKDGKTGKYFVGRKGAVGVVRLIDGIETIEEARKVYKEQQPQLQQMWNDLKIDVNERRSTNSPRVGTDYRKGKDVTPEDFNIFGFRGVQFGNYVNASERQQSLNQAYDSLYDLANVLGISPKAISLNGELGLAFGARGSGGKNAASAHYEPGQIVINLTKKKGAGSLAHEWWHAMDNYFERARGRKINYLTDSPSTRFNAGGSKDLRVREEVSQAFKEVVATIKQSGMGKRSEVLDQARSKAYWSTVIEMSARSFENYIIEKLGETGQRNDYLANFKAMSEWVEDGGVDMSSYPYPTVEETPEINKAFDNLFNTIEETESGELREPELQYGKKSITKQLPATININGVEKPTTNSEGKLIHSTEEGVRNFYEWFGDSKVVDNEGRPRPLYHETNADWNIYDKSKIKAAKSDYTTPNGIFLKSTSDKIGLGEKQVNLYANIKNPIYARDRESLESFFRLNVEGYSELVDQINKTDKEYEKRVDDEQKISSDKLFEEREKFKGEIPSPEWSAIVKENNKETYRLLSEWSDRIDELSLKAKDLLNSYIENSEYDGIFLLNDKGSWGRQTDATIALNPNQIKSATSNTGEFSPEDASILKEPGLQYKVSETGFYSTVEKALSAITQEKGTRDQFKAMLLKNGAKQAELDWMDYDGTFTGESVTKTEIQDWIDQNRIEVEEVEKGISKVEVKSIEPVSEKYATVFTVTFSDSSTVEVDLSGKYGNDPSDISEREIAEEAQRLRAEDDLTYEGDEEIRPTKYHDYQEPGGENYKELLLRMPTNLKSYSLVDVKTNKEIQASNNYEALIDKRNEIGGELVVIENEKSKGQTFKSAHFDEPNILAHIRFNERTDSEGSRVLFIEEWQADKGQEWQKLKKLIDSGKATKADIDRFNFLDKNFPFNKTSEWLNLAARRMMRYAAENGFDRIAWTTGEQQAERYDLSKQVDEIRYEKVGENYAVGAIGKNGEVVYRSMNATSSELEDAIGKEITQKIVNNEGEDGKVKGTKVLSGENLKIGGSGMKAFYDRIVPSAMSKLGKPFGAKVENIDIPTEKKIDLYSVWNNETGNSVSGGFTLDAANKFINERPDGNYSIKKESSATTTQQSIPVTESMRKTAMEGMPVFEPQQQFINFTPEEIQDETNKAHGSEEKRQEAINKTVESALQTQISGDRREGFDTGRGTTPLRQVRTILEGFKESGYVDFVGTEVSSHQDIADLWSIHRSPYIEKSHVIFIKDGMIAGSMAATSGRINQSKVNTPKEIAEHAKKIGATQVYLLHNHPSGQPNVSIPDVYVTFYTADQLRAEGIDLLGHVVVDHDKYSFIDATGEWPADLKTYTLQEWADKTPQFEYKNKVPKLFSERERVEGTLRMFEIGKSILSQPSYKGAIAYLITHEKGQSLSLAAYDILPEGATKEDAIRIAQKGLDNNLGAMVVFLHDGSLSGTWGNTPKGTVDVINIAKKDSDYFFNQSSVSEPELEQLWVREGDVEYNPQRELLDAKLNKAQIKFTNITVSPSLLREAYQDRHLPVRRFIEQLRETGLNVENFNDWYKQATHLPGKIDAQFEAFERQFLTPMLGEIDKLIKQGHSYRDVENYTILKHGIERNEWFLMQEEKKYLEKNPQATKEEISEYLSKQPQDYSGITAVQEEVEMSAEDYIKQFEEKSNTDSFWNAVKQATKYSLDKAYEGQIINKEQYNELTNRYKYYIPLRGFDKETAEDRWDYTPDMGTYYVMPLIKAKGRTSRSETPFAFIWQMAQTSINSANKNLHNLSIKRLAELDNKRYASTGLMSISRTWYEKTDEHTWELRSPEYSQDNDTYQKNIEEFENRMKLLEEQGFATQKKGKLNVGMFIKPKQAAQHEVHVMQNGEEFVIYFNGNPRVARAINGANAIHNQPNQVQQAVRQATRMMAANFTTRNPLFVLSNFLRDYNYASSTLIVKEGVEYEALFQKNIPLVMGALHRAIRGKADMTNKMDVYAYEYLMNGGRTGYSSIMELGRVQKRVERKIKRHGKENMFNEALEGLKTANEFAENLTRLSVYVTSREVGKDIIQSISDAKEVTVNFNRGGSGELGGNFFKNYYLFFNANIQALANHFKIWKGNPGRMAALTGAYALSGFIAPFLVALIGGDDGEEEYMKLSDWERQTNFSIYTGNGFIKIPIAHELRVYHTMGDLAYQWMMGYITSGDAAKKMTLSVSDLIPANPMGATEASWAELSPDLPKPFIQLITNTSFMGTRIYDKYKVEQDIPGFRMVRTNKKGEAFAPEFLIKLAEDAHYITGGDGTKGGLDFNPDKLNHIMRGYFGGLYTMSAQAADITSKGISAIETGEFKLKVRETPLKTFYASSDDLMERNSKLNAGYYDIKKESDQVRKWGKDYIKRAEKGEISIDELYKKLNEINYYYYEGGSAVGINDFLKDINKMENMLKEVSPEEQEYLEMEINRYKKDLINFYQKATKSNKK